MGGKYEKLCLLLRYAAIGTLPLKLGQNVSLIENLTDTTQDKVPEFYNTEVHRGVVNSESITQEGLNGVVAFTVNG